MKRLVSVTMFAACLLAVSAVVRAQDCSNLTNYDLRGTYTQWGSGSIDVSKFLAGIPGPPPLPAGFIPMSWVGAFTWNGAGGGGGWVSFNGGGTQMSASIVGMKYSIQPTCIIQVSFSMKINELDPRVPPLGPFTRLIVPVVNPEGKPAALELHMIWQGTAPGTPAGPVVDSAGAYRIAMQY